MSNEVRPYPGFSAMLEEFQELFAHWALYGYCEGVYHLPAGEYSRTKPRYSTEWTSSLEALGSNNIYLQAEYARRLKLFTSTSTIDISAVEDFCQRNHLSYRVWDYNHTDTLSIEGTAQAFLNSELNGKWMSSLEQIRSLAPPAQKFYHSAVMKEVIASNRHNLSWGYYTIHSDRICIDRSEDSDGYGHAENLLYTFHEHGYRNLETKDERLAFTLALCATDWGIEPIHLDWSKLRWLPDYFPYSHPIYDAPNPKPAPQPTYKDFF